MSKCTRCLTVLGSGTRLTQIVWCGVDPESRPSPPSSSCQVNPSAAPQKPASSAGSAASMTRSLNCAIATRARYRTIRIQPTIRIGSCADEPDAVTTDTWAVSPGVTCQMPSGPLGVGIVNVILVSLQLLTWNSAPSKGAPQLVPPSTKNT